MPSVTVNARAMFEQMASAVAEMDGENLGPDDVVLVDVHLAAEQGWMTGPDTLLLTVETATGGTPRQYLVDVQEVQ